MITIEILFLEKYRDYREHLKKKDNDIKRQTF